MQKENNIPDIVEAIRSHDHDQKQRMLAKETQEERKARLAHRRSLYYQNKTTEPVEQQNQRKFKNVMNMHQRHALENSVTSQTHQIYMRKILQKMIFKCLIENFCKNFATFLIKLK
ncbi:hypothetical protein F8M41_018424 [Gigaspora margarita]|uniref:Uncharacterized protein n=1 Tax=Gigaspora margarita TaxID=4874 RepID=A0A8H4ELA5_GIGMA|nr:hypothetical protein F8M41_018424 [Gigaspora margarita]